MKLHLLQILLQQESLLMLHSFFLYVQEPPLLTGQDDPTENTGRW